MSHARPLKDRLKDRLFRGRLELQRMFDVLTYREPIRVLALGISVAAVCVTGCGENPYLPSASPEDFYFAAPSAEQESASSEEKQLRTRQVAMVSGERFWEFSDPMGSELSLLPPVQSADDSYASYIQNRFNARSYDEVYLEEQTTRQSHAEPTLALGSPAPQIQPQWVEEEPAPAIPDLAEPDRKETLEPIVRSDAFDSKARTTLDVPESAITETMDSTIAVMLLPPMPMEMVSEEPAATAVSQEPFAGSDSESSSWDAIESDEATSDSSDAWSFTDQPREQRSEPIEKVEVEVHEERLALLPTPSRIETPLEEDASITPTDDKAEDYPFATETPPAIMTGVLTGAKVNERAIAKIRRGYKLAERGAYYAARSEFVGVLRMISQAKDSKHGKPRRTLALADGLRALEEAQDFAPKGVELDADVPVAVIASSHRTKIDVDLEKQLLLPQQVMDRYFRYAQFKLGGAVAGEPAGSMALHALGKLHSQLGKLEPDQHPLAARQAYAYQQAALMAHDGNHLAAHELGVLMAEAGHYQEASNLLNQVVRQQPHPTVLRNLARVQKELGQKELAVAMRDRAREMERQSGETNGVAWVSPDAFSASVASPMNMPTTARPPQQFAQRPQQPGNY